MDKQNVAYLYNRVLFSNKEEQATDTCPTMEEPGKHHTKGKKPAARKSTCDSVYMKSPEKANLEK